MPTTGVHTSPYGNVTSTGQPMYRTTIAGASDNQMAGWQNSPQSCPQCKILLEGRFLAS